MKKVIMYFVDCFRGIQHSISTYFLKKQLVAYGDNVGAARIPKIARISKVSVGHNCSFNGLTISGLGRLKLVIISILVPM